MWLPGITHRHAFMLRVIMHLATMVALSIAHVIIVEGSTLMKYGLLVRILSYSSLFTLIAAGGFGMLLPAIFAIESAVIWMLIPITFFFIIVGLAFCCDRLYKIVKEIV